MKQCVEGPPFHLRSVKPKFYQKMMHMTTYSQAQLLGFDLPVILVVWRVYL